MDAHRWLDALVRRALPTARVAPRGKFVEYVRADSEMAPHVDLSKPAAECLDGTAAASRPLIVLWVVRPDRARVLAGVWNVECSILPSCLTQHIAQFAVVARSRGVAPAGDGLAGS